MSLGDAARVPIICPCGTPTAANPDAIRRRCSSCDARGPAAAPFSARSTCALRDARRQLCCASIQRIPVPGGCGRRCYKDARPQPPDRSGLRAVSAYGDACGVECQSAFRQGNYMDTYIHSWIAVWRRPRSRRL